MIDWKVRGGVGATVNTCVYCDVSYDTHKKGGRVESQGCKNAFRKYRKMRRLR